MEELCDGLSTFRPVCIGELLFVYRPFEFCIGNSSDVDLGESARWLLRPLLLLLALLLVLDWLLRL